MELIFLSTTRCRPTSVCTSGGYNVVNNHLYRQKPTMSTTKYPYCNSALCLSCWICKLIFLQLSSYSLLYKSPCHHIFQFNLFSSFFRPNSRINVLLTLSYSDWFLPNLWLLNHLSCFTILLRHSLIIIIIITIITFLLTY